MMRTILITNDDGIEAEGLHRLAAAARDLGEVWVIAPDGQRSAQAHSITLRSHIDVMPYDFPVSEVKAFSCTGTPADCVRIGFFHWLPVRPDWVFSGINAGYNIATDIQYSATVGAAFEAALRGTPSIALSEGLGEDHSVTEAMLPGVLKDLTSRSLQSGQIFNVNFPGIPLEKCKGILENRAISACSMFRERYQELEEFPGGGKRLMVNGIPSTACEAETDFRALMDGYVSISVVNNIGA